MFEIEAIILIVFLGYQHISLMAMGFLMLSNVLLVSATWKRDHRLKYGMLITLGLMATVIGIMVIKLFMSWTIKKIGEDGFPDKCESVRKTENYYMAWGFPTKIFIDFYSTSGEILDDPCQDLAEYSDSAANFTEENIDFSKVHAEFSTFESINFEIGCLVVLAFTIYRMLKL